MTKFRIYLIIFLILMVLGMVGMRKDNDDKAAMQAVVEEIKAESEPERINMVEVIASRRPADWQPTLAYSKPGQIYYPEVFERIIKKEKQAEAWKLELWRSYREDGITIEFD